MLSNTFSSPPRHRARSRVAITATVALVAIATLVAAPARAARAQTASHGGDSLAVANAVLAYHHALRKGDSAAALALLAPDAVILESGGVESRDEYRAHHLPGDIRFVQAVPGTRGDTHVRVRGNAAWAWSTYVNQGEYRGRPINSAGAELMVLTRDAAGWKIAAIHWSSRQRK